MLEPVIVTAVIISAAVVGYSKYQALSGQLTKADELSAELYDKVVTAERAQAKAENELGFLKATVVQMLNRPILASLNDLQANQLTQAVISYMATLKNPKEAN